MAADPTKTRGWYSASAQGPTVVTGLKPASLSDLMFTSPGSANPYWGAGDPYSVKKLSHPTAALFTPAQGVAVTSRAAGGARSRVGAPGVAAAAEPEEALIAKMTAILGRPPTEKELAAAREKELRRNLEQKLGRPPTEPELKAAREAAALAAKTNGK
eukprot:2740642-Prymnesium_polylepis.1